jgi:hypothetical protein
MINKCKPSIFSTPTSILSVLVVVLIASFSACTAVRQAARDSDCTSYYTFIEAEWYLNEYGWHEFRDTNKVYAAFDEGKVDYPFSLPCLRGKDKAFIRDLLGAPDFEIVIRTKHTNFFIYCMNEACAAPILVESVKEPGLVIFFDANDQVDGLYCDIPYRYQYQVMKR